MVTFEPPHLCTKVFFQTHHSALESHLLDNSIGVGMGLLSCPGRELFKQYSTSASGVGKGYSHGWCSAVATRLEAEWRRQQHPWEYPLPTPLALVLYCFYKTIL